MSNFNIGPRPVVEVAQLIPATQEAWGEEGCAGRLCAHPDGHMRTWAGAWLQIVQAISGSGGGPWNRWVGGWWLLGATCEHERVLERNAAERLRKLRKDEPTSLDGDASAQYAKKFTWIVVYVVFCVLSRARR